MKTKEQYEALVNQASKINEKARKSVIEIVKKKGPIDFDWEDGDAPSIASRVSDFDDDITDVFITKIWYDGLLYANLHANYLCEDLEEIDLCDEVGVNWADILDWVVLYSF